MTDAVLDLIDDTLAEHDGSVSRDGLDGMRWSPGRVICDSGQPLTPERRSAWRHGTFSYSVTPGTRYELVTTGTRCEFRAAGHWTAPLAVWYEIVVPTMQHLIGVSMEFNQALELVHSLAAPLSRHRRRCPACNPRGNPEPLAINGREYRRRQLARQRRKRR